MKKDLILGSAGTFSIRILQAGTGFLTAILLARLLGPAGMGHIAAALAIISLCIIPVEAGMTKLAVRETARYFKTGEQNTIHYLKNWLRERVIAASIMVLSALVVLRMTNVLTGAEFIYASLLVSIIPARSFSLIYSGYLKGMNRPILGQTFEFVRNISYFSILLSFFLFVPEIEITGVVAALTISVLCGAIFAYAMARRNFPERTGEVDLDAKIRWQQSIVPFATLSGIAAIVAAMDVLIINALSGAAEAGIYNAAAQVAALIAFGTTAILGVSGPHFSKLFYAGDMQKLNYLVKRATQAATLLSVLFLILIFFFSEPLVQGVFGPEFLPAAAIMKALIFAQLITVFSAFSGSLLNMTGNEKILMKVAIGALVLKAGLAAMLVPNLGAQGAAISTICYATILSATSGWMVYSRIGITPFLSLLGISSQRPTSS